jgi:phospholipase/carboxylesterase
MSEPHLNNTESKTNSVTPYRLRAPQGKRDKHPALIMLHGWGANEGDIFELVPFVREDVIVAAPRAPLIATDDPRGSFCWFTSSRVGTPQPHEFSDAVKLIVDFIDRLEEASGFPVDREQVYIGGFSQGGAMSYLVTGAHPELIAGTIVHSGFLPMPPPVPFNYPALKDKPFIVLHGTKETVITLERGQDSATHVRNMGANVEFQSFPIAHETSLPSRQALADWLNKRLK